MIFELKQSNFLFKISMLILLTLMLLPISKADALTAHKASWSSYNSSTDSYSAATEGPNTFTWSTKVTNASLKGTVQQINWIKRDISTFSPTYRNVILFNPKVYGSPSVDNLSSAYGGVADYSIHYVDGAHNRVRIDYKKLANQNWGASVTTFPNLHNNSYVVWGYLYEAYKDTYIVNAVAGYHNPYNEKIIAEDGDWAYTPSLTLSK